MYIVCVECRACHNTGRRPCKEDNIYKLHIVLKIVFHIMRVECIVGGTYNRMQGPCYYTRILY